MPTEFVRALLIPEPENTSLARFRTNDLAEGIIENVECLYKVFKGIHKEADGLWSLFENT